MRFPDPLTRGRLIRRYKRFLADVQLDGAAKPVTVHCPNSGSMMGLDTPGSRVLISDSGNPKRKLRLSLEMVKVGRTWVGVNTMRPNHVVTEAIARGAVPGLEGYDRIRNEVKYGKNSRIDVLLERGTVEAPELCYVEVKNTTLSGGTRHEIARFPDAVTERGKKHLDELMAMIRQGHRAVMVFFVNRADCKVFRPADDIDPVYGKTLRRAHKAGVELIPLQGRCTARGISVIGTLPYEL